MPRGERSREWGEEKGGKGGEEGEKLGSRRGEGGEGKEVVAVVRRLFALK